MPEQEYTQHFSQITPKQQDLPADHPGKNLFPKDLSQQWLLYNVLPAGIPGGFSEFSWPGPTEAMEYSLPQASLVSHSPSLRLGSPRSTPGHQELNWVQGPKEQLVP